MIAMAEEGDLATKIAAINTATEILLLSDIPCINGIIDARTYTAIALITKVTISCPNVFHAMLFSLLRKSLRKSSEPAAKAI